ncbi:hypothetical protein QA596_08310 [Balneolales bacterium ANBcel1]|nr:hypothetical protein [Balneolales bacterium ANBcel1]
MENNTIQKTGIWLFALLVLSIGIFHFADATRLSEMMPAFIPGSIFWMYGIGLAMVIASVAILINAKAKLACHLIAVMLVLLVAVVHLPDAIGKMSLAPGLLKDTALASALLLFSTAFKN